MDFKKVNYDIDQVLDHFGLTRGRECQPLQEWLQVSVPTDYQLPELLEEKRQFLDLEGDVWNEEELKMHFLSIVFAYVRFQIPNKAKLFYERPLSAVVENTLISVICDALLATPKGVNTPKNPYFFLQEFKKGKKAADDAEGQMLLAMLIAQELNQNNQIIYGCYLMGKDWNFATLQGKNYCCSASYNASRPNELAQILHILQELKNLIKV